MKPPIPVTDPAFAYTPSHATDLRETFRRIRREQAQAAAAREAEAKQTHARAFPLARETKRRQA